MGKSLVIVESPAKASTLGRFLGASFDVVASLGHVRDLPESASEIPARVKDASWARLGVNVEGDFEPIYVIPQSKKEHIRKLRALCEQADTLYLATDEDREGESISWHLLEVLKPRATVKRLVFHEITADAIHRALAHPRDLDMNLVRAQEARRVLDRLYGYEVSPLLWRKVRTGLSAGRVQSVAVRLIVEREMARMAFRASRYWDLSARFSLPEGEFHATLVTLGGRAVAGRQDFDASTGTLKARSKALHLGEADALALVERLQGLEARVVSVEERPFLERPAPPFITSTLQQEANRKFRWSARRAMQVAQRLYENGWITYMRTDSTTLSQEALSAARDAILHVYGEDYVPARPRTYRSTSKNAQEAHEAIRPAGKAFRSPEQARAELDAEEARLYELIWKRTLACQMPDARGTRVRVHVGLDDARFLATGRSIEFHGFRRAYIESVEEHLDHEDPEALLPPLRVDQTTGPAELRCIGHETQPPPRLTEASLVKELDTLGIGRPSTYASIIETILSRKYVFKKGPALVPTFTAFAVTSLLVSTLADLLDYGFTARMEDDLDEVAMGRRDARAYLASFYRGDGGLLDRLKTAAAVPDARDLRILSDEGAEAGIVIRIGRFGPYIAQGDMHVGIPEDMPPEELNLEMAQAMLAAGAQWPRLLGRNPDTGNPIHVMKGPFGFYVQEAPERQAPEGDAPVAEKVLPAPKKRRGKKGSTSATEAAPFLRRAGLLKGMDPATLPLDQALALLSLPRSLGRHPESGVEVQATNGRFGPYVRCGADSRSLPDPSRLLVITLAEALELLGTPRGRARVSEPLREFGAHPETGTPVRLMKGRFGPFLTDGILNASIPKNQDLESLDLPQALEILKKKAERPSAPRARRTRATPA
jgi:DNA topoisomerase-1